MFRGKRPDQPMRPVSAAPTSVEPQQPLQQRALVVNARAQTLSTADDGATVHIGKGTTVSGEIRDCMRLEVRGFLDGTVGAGTVIVHPEGRIKGSVHADSAEVHGQVEGNLRVNKLLDVRSTALIDGELSYGSLAVEAGGQVSGRIVIQADEGDSEAHDDDTHEQPQLRPVGDNWTVLRNGSSSSK